MPMKKGEKKKPVPGGMMKRKKDGKKKSGYKK
jgi:hypothetical protein